MIARALGACGLATLLSSCVVLVFTRTRTNQPIDEARVEALAPGETTFGAALAALGAPSDVWELPRGARAIAYGWLDERGDNVNVQFPSGGDYAPNVEIEDGRTKLRGVVLFFDAADVLVEVRRGHLLALRRESSPSAELDQPR